MQDPDQSPSIEQRVVNRVDCGSSLQSPLDPRLVVPRACAIPGCTRRTERAILAAARRRRFAMPETERPPSPLWLRMLGGAVLALMGAGLVYAVAIGVLRFSEIGV
jgi:hypothetical protein